ncbi:MAG: hypothetical protein ACR2MA_08205 [Egibacteraceae bacterium]
MRERTRHLVAAVSALAVVGAALVIIVATSTLSLPFFPQITERSGAGIDGTVAYLRFEQYDEACLYTVPASGGTPRELRCDVGAWPGPTWTEDGNLVVAASMAQWEDAESTLVIDPESGEIVDRRRITRSPEELDTERSERFGRTERADGSFVVTESSQDHAKLVLVPSDGERRRLVNVAGPRDYGFTDVSWSPDGEWLLVTDTAQRLLIVNSRNGRTRLLATDAEQAVWHQP